MPAESTAQFIDVCQKLYKATWKPMLRWWKSTPESRQQGQHHRPGRQVQLRRPTPLFRHPEIVAPRDLDEEDPAEIEAPSSTWPTFSWTATLVAW